MTLSRSFRGHGIVDSNGVLVAAISVANGATGNFDTVQVGSGGLTASNATLTGSLSVTGALTATGPVNLAASASASGYALTVGPTGADFCVPVVFHNSHVDVPTASEDDDAEAVNWGLMRDYVTDTLRCDCTCHDAITNETDTLQTVTTRGHTTTCSISIGPAGTSAGGQYTFAQGPHAVADGTGSHAEGDGSQAHGVGSHAEGCSTASADAAYAHTEGSGTALGPRSHAEGTGTETDCEASHAEGAWSEAWGDDSHAEGVLSEAWGDCSHAEGFWTEAHGTVSHAAGENAKANDDNTYVWSDGTGISSSTNEQYTVYAGNGIRLLGGETEISSTRVHGAARFESGIIYTARLGDISMGSFTNQMTP